MGPLGGVLGKVREWNLAAVVLLILCFLPSFDPPPRTCTIQKAGINLGRPIGQQKRNQKDLHNKRPKGNKGFLIFQGLPDLPPPPLLVTAHASMALVWHRIGAQVTENDYGEGSAHLWTGRETHVRSCSVWLVIVL